MTQPKHAPGPFRTWQLSSGDPYELSQGHAIYAAPTGHDGAGPNLRGGLVLDTDPLAPAVGVDAGIALGPDTLRAPDLAVGLGPERPGWGSVAPPLAVEYASVGQDEAALQQKIVELHAGGTRWVWVVRLIGPRRVEVHEQGQPVRVVGPGQSLTAPGVLRNAVAIEALYDREVAHEAALRNLLQRQGYESLDAVRSEGREEGREEGARALLRATVTARGWALSAEQSARVDGCRDVAQLGAWAVRVVTAATADEAFG